MGDAACEGGHQIVFVVWVELMVFAPVTSKVACASNLEKLGSGTPVTMRATRHTSLSLWCARWKSPVVFSPFFLLGGPSLGPQHSPNSVVEIPRRQFEALLFQYAEGEGVWV